MCNIPVIGSLIAMNGKVFRAATHGTFLSEGPMRQCHRRPALIYMARLCGDQSVAKSLMGNGAQGRPATNARIQRLTVRGPET